MTGLLFLALFFIVLSFGFVLCFGAPYLPTLSRQQRLALELMDLQKDQVMLELGSGDGRMLKQAALLGIKAIGYEMNPFLVLFSKVYCWRYRHLVTVHLANFWTITLPECDGIYVFLLDKYMERLYKKITQDINRPVKLVSFAFPLPPIEPELHSEGLYLYTLKP